MIILNPFLHDDPSEFSHTHTHTMCAVDVSAGERRHILVSACGRRFFTSPLEGSYYYYHHHYHYYYFYYFPVHDVSRRRCRTFARMFNVYRDVSSLRVCRRAFLSHLRSRHRRSFFSAVSICPCTGHNARFTIVSIGDALACFLFFSNAFTVL